MNVLLVEDSADDAELVVRELRRNGAAVEVTHVQTAETLLAALERDRWDVVISDNALPNFSGSEALKLVKERDPELPFILVSGSIGEEAAVEKLKAGADDYVLKGNLARLRSAIEHQMRAAEARRAHRGAQEELRRFRLALDNSADMILIIDRATMRYVDVNQTACTLLGYSRDELLRMSPEEILPVSRLELEKIYDGLIASPAAPSGMRSYYRCKDGTPLHFESTRHVLRSGDTWLIAAISRDIRERLATEQALREREAGLRRAQAMAKLAHVVTGEDGVFETWSDTLPQLIGVEPHDMPRRTREWLELLHPDERTIFRATAIEAGATRERKDLQYRLRRADGAWIHVRHTLEPLPAAEGMPVAPRWFNTIQDVTEQTQASEGLARLNRVYAVLSSINSLIVRTRDRGELFREACRIAVNQGGFRAAWLGFVEPSTQRMVPAASSGPMGELMQRVEGQLVRDAQNPVTIAVRERKPFISNDVANDSRLVFREEHKRLGTRSLAILPLMVQGEVIGVLTLHATEDGFFDAEELKLLLELADDIAFAVDYIAKLEKIDYLAYYDSLTGLANPTLFQEHLVQFVRAAERDQHRLALMIFDIERFKSINDSLGRQAGDALLKQLGERMVRSRNDPSRVGRLGADQFALVLPRVRGDDQLARSIETRLHEFFDAPFKLGDTELRISAKLGIAVFPDDAANAETLFKQAEAALKNAKSSGERYVFYTRGTTERISEKLNLESRLRRALENDEFVLHYQPKVDLERRQIVGVEALIRWQTQDRGLVPPAHFIPLLEETGLILQVGSWALTRAARDHHNWVKQDLKVPRVAVNVSQVQLRQRDFVVVVEQAIVDGVIPTAIDLEITESLVMEDVKANIEKLKAVRELGVRVAIDDFGTGYSSLGYLAQLPVESLKIDRSFIIKMTTDPNVMTLVSTIISLAHSLRLKVVAEGVETEDQAKFLRLLRCDEMQGYLFSKPLPEEELVKLLRG